MLYNNNILYYFKVTYLDKTFNNKYKVNKQV